MKFTHILFLSNLSLVMGCVSYVPTSTSATATIHELSFVDEGTTSYIKEHPFQVLYVEGGKRKGDTLALKSLAKLSIYEDVELDSLGYMILVHYSGRFLEFDGAMTISIFEQLRLIREQYNIGLSDKIERAGIRRLFSIDRLHRVSRGSVERSWGADIDFVLPVSITLEISENRPQLCLMWQPVFPQPNPYIVRIVSIYDKTLDEFEVDGTSFNLDLSKYVVERKLFLKTRVFDKYDREFSSSEIGIKLGEQYSFFPVECDINSAVQALELGFYLEANGNDVVSKKYYQLATVLSDRLIFVDFLEQPTQRWSGND